MSTSTAKAVTGGGDIRVLSRILDEGYGAGAWHGPDIKAALDGISDETAFWRPGKGRHNIAEIAVHHAFHTQAVRGKLSGKSEPFALEGEDWFALENASAMSWPEIQKLVEANHQQLAQTVTAIGEGKVKSPLAEKERFDLILGITCHANYHAGQIQLLRRICGK